ncbi:MAG: response regulator [Pseudanabaenaceae cyanobacterium bins.68]|nr:response regulator [Pseudanabaenaceae cyanobacterium bins.68]
MRHILVIEDDEDLQELIKEILVNQNYQVTSARNGEEGLALAISLQPDLILSDIRMPGISGYQVLEQIRHHEKLRNTPVIFISGLTDREHLRLGMNRGADDYLPKGFTKEQLLNSVQARLQRLTSQEQEQLNQQNEFARRLALAIPHELRTPLFGISSLSSLLLDGYQTLSREQIFEYVKDIQASGDRLSALIQNYVDYAEFYLYQPRLQAEVDRREITQLNIDLLQNLGGHIAKKYDRLADLQINEVISTGLLISPTRLYKVLYELIDNGFKFSKPGQMVQLDAWQDRESTVIRISDQGRGLTPAQISKIGAFQQFERHRYEQQGMGLGLTISKSLLEIFGGSLQIKSVPGQFTHVLCSLKSPLYKS